MTQKETMTELSTNHGRSCIMFRSCFILINERWNKNIVCVSFLMVEKDRLSLLTKTTGIKFFVFFFFWGQPINDMTIYFWLVTVLFITFLTMVMVTFFCIESFIFFNGRNCWTFLFMPLQLNLVFKLHAVTNSLTFKLFVLWGACYLHCN